MKWILYILGGLVGLILIIVLIGALLPKKHKASVTKVLPTTPDKVWQLISDFGNYHSWRKLKALEVIDDKTWRETDERNTKITMGIVESSKPTKLVSKIMDEKLPFGGTWTFQLEAINHGQTKLTITEDGEIYNPLFRFFARFFFGYDATMKQYVAQMETHLNS